MKRVFVLFMLVVLSLQSQAQTTDETFTVEHRPMYFYPSDETMAQIKHAVWPTGLATGVPKIEIPLWGHENTSVGFSLRYHASGIQVAQKSSNVGLGWSLSGGGVVARIVRGYPDELKSYGMLNLSSYQQSTLGKGLNEIDDTQISKIKQLRNYDIQPDLFFYSFPGYEGRFMLKKENGKVVAQNLPHNNVQIDVEVNFSDYEDNYITSFEFNLPNGQTYVFAKREKIQILQSSISLPFEQYISAWYLSRIKTVESSVLELYYKEKIGPYDQQVYYEDLDRNLFDYSYHDLKEGVEKTGTHSCSLRVWQPKLKTVVDHEATAKFKYSGDKLTEIKIYGKSSTWSNDYNQYNKYDNLVCGIDFLYTNTTTDRYLLDAVKMGVSQKRNYNFTYYEDLVSSGESPSQDLWGFYNGQSGEFIPSIYEEDGFYSAIAGSSQVHVGGNRHVDADQITSAMLHMVETPTGAVTTYEYEAQRFNFEGALRLGGGVRVKSIHYNDPLFDTPDKTVYYNYFDDSGNESGVLLNEFTMAYPYKGSAVQPSFYKLANYSYGLPEGGLFSVFYPRVMKDEGEAGYSITYFKLPDRLETLPYYHEVNNATTTHTSLVNGLSSNLRVQPLNRAALRHGSDWLPIYMDKQLVFDNTGGKISILKNHYGNLEAVKTNHRGLMGPFITHSLANGGISGGGLIGPGGQEATIEPIDGDGVSTIDFLIWYDLTYAKGYNWTAWQMLESQEKTVFENGQAFVSTTTYQYDPVNSPVRLPIRVEEQASTGRTIIRETTYPHHYDITAVSEEAADAIAAIEQQYVAEQDNLDAYGTTDDEGERIVYYTGEYEARQLEVSVSDNAAALQKLRERNLFTTPIEALEKIVLPDGTEKILSAELTLFKEDNKRGIKPTQKLVVNGPLNNFSPLNLKYSGSFVWLEHDAQYNRVMQMTYDDHGKLEMKTDAYGKTTAYLWSEEGQYLIAKAENGTPDDLTYYTSTDRLKSRNFSANALITTYDYIPLVGKIQEFDARGRGLYYAYDNDGNLIGIRDHEGNIRKMYTSQIRNESGNRRESGKNIKSINVDAKIPEPHVYASFSKSEGKISVMCQNLHPAFSYKLEEDNGSIHEIENGDRTFVLSAKEGIRAYTLRQYKEDIIVGEFYDEVQVEFAPLSVSFSSEDILTTTPLGDKRRTGIILKASAEGADGDYDFRWEVLSAPRGFSSILLLDYYFDNSTKAKLTDVPAGIYHVRCYVQSNGEIKTKDWEFIISDGGY